MARRNRRPRTVARVIRMPADWWTRIDNMKPQGQSAAEFVRRIVHARINNDPAKPLSEPKSWGGVAR